MNTSRPTIDPNHEARRAALSRVGLVLVGIGVPTALTGLILFVSVFFTGFDDFGPPIRPIVGILMLGGGGFLSMFGLQALTFGNIGRILRYQVGETLPVAEDAARTFAPTAQDLARGMAGAVRDGFAEGTPAAKVQHACGAWNEADARFCKGCGSALATPVCSKCGAPVDPESRYCTHCGAERAMMA